MAKPVARFEVWPQDLVRIACEEKRKQLQTTGYSPEVADFMSTQWCFDRALEIGAANTRKTWETIVEELKQNAKEA